MDALQGYGSSSDSEDGQARSAGVAAPLQGQELAQGAPLKPSGNAGRPATTGVVLPSAADLFAAPSQPPRPTMTGLRTARGAVQKRQQPGGLRGGPPHPPKAQQLAAGVRPMRHGSGALVPPQLRGRANVVTEDLDRLFTKKAKSPQAEQQQQLTSSSK